MMNKKKMYLCGYSKDGINYTDNQQQALIGVMSNEQCNCNNPQRDYIIVESGLPTKYRAEKAMIITNDQLSGLLLICTIVTAAVVAPLSIYVHKQLKNL